MGNKKYTFRQLLTAQKVEIPVLQRDYVQGNLKDRKADSIREDFVSDLVSHLTRQQPDEMTLDFIYGKIIDDDLSEEQERREEHLESLLDTVSEYAKKNGFEIQKNFKRVDEFISKETFVPFDGQQRLTTLFLLHFLIYARLGKDISFLHQFLYKTRESSRDFLEALLNNANDFRLSEVWQHSFVSFVEDRNWFYDFWKYDPTVMSMMVMLNAFREKLIQLEDSDIKISAIYQNLDSNNILTFDFLDIDEHQLDDTLYVKMNASGKELTDFEKFKSWLIEYVESKELGNLIDEEDWEIKLDTVWYDLFWAVDRKKPDALLYQYIRKMLMFSYCSKELGGLDDEEKQKLQKTRKLIYDNLNSNDPISFKFYTDHNIINAESLNFIWCNLNMLTENSGYVIFDTCLRKIWTKTFSANWNDEQFNHFVVKSIGSVNLFHQTFLFSVFMYTDELRKNSQVFNEENFLEWIRLSRNLVYNSRIDDSAPFFNALQSLKKLGNNCLCVKPIVTHEKFIEYFPEQQRKEEFRKNQDLYYHWKDDFIKAENHSYFYGQINFLIEMSKDAGLADLNRFRDLVEIVGEIFSEENLDNDNLISRSLLTINDNWMPDYGSSRFLFCLSNRGNSRDRDENWRRVFNDSSKRNALIELVGYYKPVRNLSTVISMRKEFVGDWRRLFLEYPKELKYCKQGLINYANNGNYIRLLGQSRLSHYHRELRTSILFNKFLRHQSSLQSSNYIEMKSDDDCYISISKDNVEITVMFDFKSSTFRFHEKTDDDSYKDITINRLAEMDSQLYTIIKDFNLYIN